MCPIHLAQVGFGYWGKKLFREFSMSPLFTVGKVFERNPQRAQEILDIGGVPVNNLDDILNDTDIVGVIIATPVDTHFELGRRVLAAGKALFMEKTLASSSSEAHEMERIALKQQCPVLVDYTFSFSPGIQLMVKLAKTGQIGRICGASLIMTQLGRFNEHNVYRLLGSHMLAVLDQICPLRMLTFSCHDIVVRDGLTESGVILFGKCASHGCNMEDFSGAAYVSLNDAHRQRIVELYGEAGTIHYDALAPEPLTIQRYRVSRAVTDQPLDVVSYRRSDHAGERGIPNAIAAFHALLTAEACGNLSMAVIIEDILDSLPQQGRGIST